MFIMKKRILLTTGLIIVTLLALFIDALMQMKIIKMQIQQQIKKTNGRN